MHPEWELSDDRKTVTLRIPVEPKIELTFRAAELDELLDGLGRYRAAMVPPVADQPANDPMATMIKDTTIAVEQADSGVVFHVRDPRFAWLRYHLPLDAAQALGATLASLPGSPTPGPGTKTIN